MQISFEKAREFLKEIKKEDRVALIFHNDLDGFASGILFYDFLVKQRCEEIGVFPKSLDIDNFKNLDILEKYNKILIADIPPFFVGKNFEKLKERVEVFYTDHHQKETEISDFVLEYRTCDLGYIPSSRSVYELVGGKEWLSVAGTISDFGDNYSENNEFINSFLEKEGLEIKEFKKTVVYPINNFLVYYSDNLDSAFEILKKTYFYNELEKINEYSEKIEEELKYFREDFEKDKQEFGNILYFCFEPKYKIKSTLVSSLSREYPKKVLIFAIPQEDKIGLSARNNSQEINTIETMKKIIGGLKNASVGGHFAACGGFIQKEDLEEFRDNLKKLF